MTTDKAGRTIASPEMIDAYVNWEPPYDVDLSRPVRALGLIRAAFFAGWIAALASKEPEHG